VRPDQSIAGRCHREAVVNTCLVKLTLVSSCALAGLPALAAAPTQPHSSQAQPQPTVAAAPTPSSSSTMPRARTGAAVVTITAAGSVIVLADGIVAQARLARIDPPAPGFVYER